MPKKGYKQTEEHKRKVSKAKKGDPRNKYWLGKKKSNESKLKMSKKRKRLFKEGKLKPSKSNLGKKVNKEVRKKLSKIHKLNYKLGKEKPYWLGKKRSEETRLKHSKTRKRLFMEGKLKLSSSCFKKGDKKLIERRKKLVLPLKDSKIEVKIQNFLEQLKIEFFTHKYMNIKHAYQCDILIPQWNMIIECDGDIFHFNPKLGYKSNDKIFKTGITAKERWMLDYLRTKELQEKGYVVLRLWETDINKMDIEKFKILLEDNIK